MEKSKNSDENQGSQVSVDKKRRRKNCVVVNENRVARREKVEKYDVLEGFWKILCQFFTWQVLIDTDLAVFKKKKAKIREFVFW